MQGSGGEHAGDVVQRQHLSYLGGDGAAGRRTYRHLPGGRGCRWRRHAVSTADEYPAAQEEVPPATPSHQVRPTDFCSLAVLDRPAAFW